MMRRFEEAIAEGKQALACNPLSVRISQHLGYTLYCSGNDGEAIRQYQRTLELDSNDSSVHESLGDAYERNGQYREAIEQWKQAMILAKDEELAASLCIANGKERFGSAVRAVALKRLERLKHRKESGDYIPSIHFARAYLRAGEQQQALSYLKLACEERNVYALMIGCDPVYDPLRADKRFIKLLQRMKLTC